MSGPALRPEDFALYRRLHARADAAGRGGRLICACGQQALAADQGVSVATIGRRLRRLAQAGLIDRPPQITRVGYRARGRIRTLPTYVLAVDLCQLRDLEQGPPSAAGQPHIPSSHRSITPEEPVSAGRTVRSRDSVIDALVSSTLYVVPTTGEDVTEGGVGGPGGEGEIPPVTHPSSATCQV